MNIHMQKFLTLSVYVGMVAVNYLAVLLPLGGRDTGEISDSYPNLFAPAGYAFSIWGLIYTLLGIYVVYQFFGKNTVLLSRVNRMFIANAVFNASWIIAWHYNVIWLSVLIMFGLLVTLIGIADLFRTQTVSRQETWLVRLPFSVYFGWITVATIANVTVFLVYLGWNGFGLPETFWTVVILLVGAGIGVWRMLKDRFVPYGLVLVWAYGAILAKHLSSSGFSGQYPSVIVAVAAYLFVFTGVILYVLIKKK